jgi:hypothetical protein
MSQEKDGTPVRSNPGQGNAQGPRRSYPCGEEDEPNGDRV